LLSSWKSLHFALFLWDLFIFNNLGEHSRGKGSKHMHVFNLLLFTQKLTINFLLNDFFHSLVTSANSSNLTSLCKHTNSFSVGKSSVEQQENQMAAALILAKAK
jgi:hypothetical protein